MSFFIRDCERVFFIGCAEHDPDVRTREAARERESSPRAPGDSPSRNAVWQTKHVDGINFIATLSVEFMAAESALCNAIDVAGWLEPLLDRIARNRTTVVCPIIDTIEEDTFEYKYQKKHFSIGGFNWNLIVRNVIASKFACPLESGFGGMVIGINNFEASPPPPTHIHTRSI